MILLFGFFVAMIFGMHLFRSGVSESLGILQRRFLSLKEPSSIVAMLVTTKLCAFSQGSFLQNQYSAMALLNSRSFSKRYAVLFLCLAAVGTWTSMTGILLAWQVNGSYLLGFAGVLFLGMFWLKRGRSFMKAALGLGLFLQQAEMLLQRQPILFSVLGESDFHFLLADGRFSAQLIWMLTVFLITLIIQVESWAVFLALVLWVSGSLSLNGAVAFIIGEMLAHVWVLVWRTRKLNKEAKSLAQDYAVANTVALLLAFFLAGFLREIFSWGLSFDLSQIAAKGLQFFSLYLMIVVSQIVVSLAWGHFAAQKKLDEVQTGEYFSVQWISRRWIGTEILSFLLNKFQIRLDLLVAQNKSMTSAEKSQIPAPFLQEHTREINSLAMWLPRAVATQKPF